MTDSDSVTRLASRNACDDELPALHAQALTDEQPFALVLADIDRFKQVNDLHGHPKGDDVLRGVAERLTRVVSGKGRVYRYGGEEFLIALHNHDADEATSVAERCRKAIAESRIGGLEVTASFGVAVAGKHGELLAEVIRSADAALYDAKNRGRNLVRLPGEPAPSAVDRKPARRPPSASGFTEHEIEQIRTDYFLAGVARCPRDSALLTIHELPLLGRVTPLLGIQCRLCGTTGRSDAA